MRSFIKLGLTFLSGLLISLTASASSCESKLALMAVEINRMVSENELQDFTALIDKKDFPAMPPRTLVSRTIVGAELLMMGRPDSETLTPRDLKVIIRGEQEDVFSGEVTSFTASMHYLDLKGRILAGNLKRLAEIMNNAENYMYSNDSSNEMTAE